MANLYAALIRHGDYRQLKGVPSAYQPFGLTKKGIAQSHQAVTQLKALAQTHQWHWVSEVDSSILLRAWQTANTIHQAIEGLKRVTMFEALCERCVGSVANLTVEQIETILEDDPRYEPPPENWKSNSIYKLPFSGAESLMEAGQRTARHLTQRMEALKGNVKQNRLKIFVGHGAAFRHAAHYLGILKFEEIAQLSMYHAQPIIFQYHSKQSWEHIAGAWKVRKSKNKMMD